MTRYRVSGYFKGNRHRNFTGEFHTLKTGTDFMVALSKWLEQEAKAYAEYDDYGDRKDDPEFHLNSVTTIRRQVVEL